VGIALGDHHPRPLRRHPGLGAAGRVQREGLRQIQLDVDQRLPPRGHIRRVHRHLTVLHLPGHPGVLPRHPHGVAALCRTPDYADVEDIGAGHGTAGPGDVGIIPVLRGRPGAGLITSRGRALVGCRQAASVPFLEGRRSGADLVHRVDCGTIMRSLWRTIRDPSSSSPGEEQSHGARIMPIRLTPTNRLTSTDLTEVGIIPTSA